MVDRKHTYALVRIGFAGQILLQRGTVLVFFLTQKCSEDAAAITTHAGNTYSVEQLCVCLVFRQTGTSMVSCVFSNDVKEYLVVGTAYVREEVRQCAGYGWGRGRFCLVSQHYHVRAARILRVHAADISPRYRLHLKP